MKQIFAIILFLMTVTVGYAQSVVKGNVTDSKGEPLIGATVKPVGSKTGTITDIDGNYTITTNAKVVEISYVGCKTARVNVKNGRADAKLADDSNVLNELVAVGYGSVKKGDITNAVAQLKADAIEDRPVTNVAEALQGELAGVDVQSTSGQPGETVSIKVRGATNINEDGNVDPLYVVDGIPMDEGFDLSQLNPQDIASVDVLKDASSSAIYGSRGANGVILITTKKVDKKDGTIRVNASVNFAVSNAERKMNMMTTDEWINMRTNIMNWSASGYLSNTNVNNYNVSASDSYADRIAVVGSADKNKVPDPRWSMAGYGGLNAVDWQNAMLRTGYKQTYNLSIQAGNKQSSFIASAAYTKQSGIVIGTGFQRLNVKLSGQTTIKDKLTVSLDVSPQMTVMDGGNVDGDSGTMLKALQMVPITEQDAGLYSGTEPYRTYKYAGGQTSPVTIMEDRKYRDETIRIVTNAKIRYDITKDWNAEVVGSWIFNNRDKNLFVPNSASRYWYQQSDGYFATGQWTTNRSHKYLIQATTTYKHIWGKHSLNGVAGWSYETTRDGYNYTQNRTNYTDDSVQSWTITSGTTTTNSMTYLPTETLISYFARGEYGFDSRYLLTASIRRDGSSRFGANRKWGTFPAVSAAWRINNEKFWQPTWVMNQLKLRVSYGSNGSNAISTNAALGLMEASTYSSEGKVIGGYIPASLENLDLGWQKTNSWNFGVDMSFFRNRISFAVDYYIKDISDMLYQVTLPSTVGVSNSKAWSNIGNVRTKGVEMELKTENLTGKLKWTTKASVSYTTNEVTDLGNNKAYYCGYEQDGVGQTQIVEVGHPVGEYYMYIADGVFANETELAQYPHMATATVGSVRYRDVNGDGKIDTNDRTYCGKSQPSWTFGLTNTFKWKKWDASILITAQLGGKIWSALGRAVEFQGSGVTMNLLERAAGQWISDSHPGDGVVPALTSGAQEEYSTRWLYSTDYVKLKNITIGYRFNFNKRAFLRMLRLTFSAENLLMIDRYDNGFSPESNNGGSQLKAYDYGAYPLSRTFSLGAQVQF